MTQSCLIDVCAHCMLFHVRVSKCCALMEILGLWLHAQPILFSLSFSLCVCVYHAFVYVSVCVNQQEHNGIRWSVFGLAGERELFNPESSQLTVENRVLQRMLTKAVSMCCYC